MKFKRWVSIILSIIVISALLVGCTNKSNSDTVSNEKISYEINSTKNSNNKVETNKFNLGTSEMVIRGKSIPFNMEGIISVPENIKEKAPVVLIFHGQHGDGENDFEDGFKYLTEALAKNGIIGVSIDTSVNYTFKYGEPVENERITYLAQTYIQTFKDINEGKKNGFGLYLKDKVDLNRIGLIGHSVAGSGVIKIAEDQIQKGFKGIKGIISLTPAYNSPIEKFTDIPTAIIVSEYDGDVVHSGDDIFYDISLDKNRKSPLGLTYLVGGNHNAYNSVLGEKEFSKPQTTNGTYPEKLGQEEHRDFFSNYAVDYMKSIFEFDSSESPIFNKKGLPYKMYGYQTLNKVKYSESVELFNKKTFKNISSSNVDIKELVESERLNKDTAKIFINTGVNEDLDLLQVDWKSESGKIELPLNNNNLGAYSALKFRWALNSPSKLNNKDNVVSFKLSLVDSKGKESSIIVENDKVSAMKYFEGEVIKDEYVEGKFMEFWSRYTPISDTVIPLEKFRNINLSNIKNVTIEFESPETGSIMLNKIVGIK
ncbi:MULTISPECIES: hypothetical protein [unclassified Clostridioides]|uniref:hypothetical protein n=1 Tax=unclassified Clostridioides TaxID=2635829 RepID=UPI001D118ABA|nr:hypothetical protein [Clostridioides sp. ES-S-0049-03]MCC0676548.1 hypothetical protein [Clostridioides sp. ES-W-0018-02]MCC0711251.1 hypothetical protein [Clostridioides sp. ES-W-0017-02]